MSVNTTDKVTKRSFSSYPGILDAHDLAHLLNLGTPKTYRLLRTGEISSRRLGDDYRKYLRYCMGGYRAVAFVTMKKNRRKNPMKCSFSNDGYYDRLNRLPDNIKARINRADCGLTAPAPHRSVHAD